MVTLLPCLLDGVEVVVGIMTDRCNLEPVRRQRPRNLPAMTRVFPPRENQKTSVRPLAGEVLAAPEAASGISNEVMSSYLRVRAG